MAGIWLKLATIIYVFQGVDSQDCISIEVGYDGPDSATWSFGIEKIQYKIRGHSCDQVFNLNVSWTEDYEGKIPKVNGIITTDQITNNGWNLMLSNLTGNFSTVLTLVSKEMNDSFLIVSSADLKIKTKNITFGYCNSTYKYEQTRTEDCQIDSSFSDDKIVNGRKTMTCGNFTNWVQVVPSFQDKSGTHLEAAVGEEFNMKILFHADPPVPYSDISVKNSEGNLTEFYFRRTNKNFHEVLIYFPKVREESYGNYTIALNWVNETCDPQTTPIVVVMTKGKGDLTIGWIATICVGSFAFLLLIGLIVASVVACRRKGKQEGSSEMVLVDMQNNKPRNSHSANQNRPVPAPPTTSQSHVNTNYNGYDEDEFDDDYENMDKKPVEERPPMPLPPSAHDGGGRPQPSRSPRHSPRLGYEQPRRGLPEPRSVGPPRANQGLIPQQPNREASLSVSPDWTSRGGPRSPGYGQDYPNDSRSTMTLPMQHRMYDQPPVSSNRYR